MTLEDQNVTLKSRDVNPFSQWSDWYGTDGEAVVTFQHMKYYLYQRWQNDCISFDHSHCDHESLHGRLNCDNGERRVEHEKFNVTNIRSPGVYLDGTHYDDDSKVDESYTIILPTSLLTPELCRQWLEKLNEKYDRDFELAPTDEQVEHGKKTLEEATDMKLMDIEEDDDEATA